MLQYKEKIGIKKSSIDFKDSFKEDSYKIIVIFVTTNSTNVELLEELRLELKKFFTFQNSILYIPVVDFSDADQYIKKSFSDIGRENMN